LLLIDKLYKSDGEQGHDDSSITDQTNRALYQTDNKWDDNYRLLDELGNLKVTTCLFRLSLLFVLFILPFSPLDKLYTSDREQLFDDRNIRDQANRALYQTEDEWNDIESVLDELGNMTFSNCIKTTTEKTCRGIFIFRIIAA